MLVTAFPICFCLDASSDERATLSIISQDTSGCKFTLTFSYVKFLIDLLRSISFFEMEIFFSAKLLTISFVLTEPNN